MKPQELRSLSKEELLEKERKLKEELYKLNMQRYGGRVEKPHMFSSIKRDIARIETILNEKKIYQIQDKTRIHTNKNPNSHK